MKHRLIPCLGVSLILAACGGGGGGGGNNPPPPPPADTTAPSTTLTATPDALTNSTTANFTFTANETATFEVRLDGAAFAAATSPHALTGLAGGAHTFEVRARDAANNVDATPASFTWTIDVTAPDTTLAGGPPPLSNSATATFTFSSNELAVFEMSLDGGAFAAATSPHTVTGLGSGSHTYAVRARDSVGNIDATPASYTWTVDVAAPDTTINTGPPTVSSSTLATFTFSANDSATFESRLDGAAFALATSPQALTGLATGSHTFEVRARDAAGNVDPTPASLTWTVNSAGPQAAIVFPTPVSYTDAGTITVRGIASGLAPLQSVSVNGVVATTATAFTTWSATIPVAVGNNSVTVSVTDAAATTNPNAATATIANRGPPLLQSGGTDYDPTTDSVIIADVEANRLVGYRLSDGIGRVISTDSQAADPNDTILSDLVVDATNNRALAIDWAQDAIVAINLTTGARTTLSTWNGVAAVSLSIGNGIAYDATNNRLFVTAAQFPANTHAIIRVNLADGSRAVVSNASVGTGPAFTNAGAIVYDAANTRLLVAATAGGNQTILQVNIASGDRVVFSQSPGSGNGPAIPFPSGFHLDAANSRLYVSDASINPGLFHVDLGTGDRVQIAGAGTGSGASVSLLGGGLALKSSTGQLLVPLRNGEVQSVNTTSFARTVFVNPRVGSGVDMDRPFTVRAEQTSGTITSLLFSEPDGQRLMRLGLANSTTSIVSGGAVGTGTPLNRFLDFVPDTRSVGNGNAAFALLSSPSNTLQSIDLTTGDRTLVAALSPNQQLRNLQLDAGANRVLFTNLDFSGSAHGLYAADILTGGVTTISSNGGVGSGTAFTGPTHFVLEPEVNPTRALVVELNPGAFNQVNLANGARSSFVSTSGNPALPLLGPIHFDRPNSQIYGLNLYPAHLYVIRVAAGGGETSRAFLSGTNPSNNLTRGTGPVVDFGTGLAVDTLRNVAFVGESTMGAIMAIDLVSGDRVIIAR